jgi:hypothetical protein
MRPGASFTFSVACRFCTLSGTAAETVSGVTLLQSPTGKHALRNMARNVRDLLGRSLNTCKGGLRKAAITVTPAGPVYPEPTTATATWRAIGRQVVQRQVAPLVIFSVFPVFRYSPHLQYSIMHVMAN